MKLAVLKPDYGVAGGFEYLLSRLTSHLAQSGHDLTEVSIPGKQAPRPIWGQVDAVSRWFEHPDYFNYLGMVHDTRQLDLTEFDVVLSTQPPSYLLNHDRVLALFYHQARIFYELSELYIEAGFVDKELHRSASAMVQSIDAQHIAGVRHWLAGSGECADRISASWGPDHAPVSLLDAPPLTEVPDSIASWSADGPVVCVGRHEWPKRSELVVAAGHLLNDDRRTLMIGAGGRQAAAEQLNQELRGRSVGDIDRLGTERSMTAPIATSRGVAGLAGAALAKATNSALGHRVDLRRLPGAAASPVSLLGHVSNDERNKAYASASVVVAPAYREDYGLTALEAMVWNRPVVVCNDGGGLVELVKATGAGLVVEPSPSAIADAVHTITSSPELARELVGRAKEVSRTYTWDRAFAQLDTALAAI